MIIHLRFLLLSSLLADAMADDDATDHRRHHQPDTAPDMELKPAYVRTTRPPPHFRHFNDFSLPLPGVGAWDDAHTESDDDYEEVFYTEVTEAFTELASFESGDYGEKPHDHDHHHHHHQKDAPQEDQESEDSFNDHLASTAAAKLPGTFLLLAGLLLILT